MRYIHNIESSSDVVQKHAIKFSSEKFTLALGLARPLGTVPALTCETVFLTTSGLLFLLPKVLLMRPSYIFYPCISYENLLSLSRYSLNFH